MGNFYVRNAIKWFGAASIFLEDTPYFYIAPYKIAYPSIGDAIMITHDHPMHCDPDEIKWLRKGSTIIVCPERCAPKFVGDIRIAKPGDELIIKGALVKVMPAYMPSGCHAKESGGVGYIVTMTDGQRVYQTGDSGLIPEMKEGLADLVLIPIDGEGNMDAAQAAEVINVLKPKVAVPVHYKPDRAGKLAAERFKSLCITEVELLKVIK